MSVSGALVGDGDDLGQVSLKKVVTPTWFVLPYIEHEDLQVPDVDIQGPTTASAILKVMINIEGPLSWFRTFAYRGGYIGARARHDIILIWFGYISCPSHWFLHVFLPAISTYH